MIQIRRPVLRSTPQCITFCHHFHPPFMMVPALKYTKMKWRNSFIFLITVLAVHLLCECEKFVAVIAGLFVCLSFFLSRWSVEDFWRSADLFPGSYLCALMFQLHLLFIYLLFLIKLRPDNLSRIFFRNHPCNLATCLRSRALYPGEIWKRNFRSENTQMVSVHTNLDKFENATITGHFGFAFEGNSGREITWLSWRHRSRKAQFSKCFPSTLNCKGSVFKFLQFEERFRKNRNKFAVSNFSRVG